MTPVHCANCGADLGYPFASTAGTGHVCYPTSESVPVLSADTLLDRLAAYRFRPSLNAFEALAEDAIDAFIKADAERAASEARITELETAISDYIVTVTRSAHRADHPMYRTPEQVEARYAALLNVIQPRAAIKEAHRG